MRIAILIKRKHPIKSHFRTVLIMREDDDGKYTINCNDLWGICLDFYLLIGMGNCELSEANASLNNQSDAVG